MRSGVCGTTKLFRKGRLAATVGLNTGKGGGLERGRTKKGFRTKRGLCPKARNTAFSINCGERDCQKGRHAVNRRVRKRTPSLVGRFYPGVKARLYEREDRLQKTAVMNEYSELHKNFRGTILILEDGGKTWSANGVRGKPRHDRKTKFSAESAAPGGGKNGYGKRADLHQTVNASRRGLRKRQRV